RDVVIDMFCYRRHGHNEGDEPAFTQPITYSKIRSRPSLTSIYTEQLIMTGDLTVAETEAITTSFEQKLQSALEEVRTGPAEYHGMHGFEGQWKGLSSRYSHQPVETGVPEETLRLIAERLTHVPANFALHPTIKRILERRQEEVLKRQPVDWAFGEL